MKIENSIVFEGFKVIKHGFTLKNLAKINYLVGPNGSGKSTILNMLSNEPKRVRICFFDGKTKGSKLLSNNLESNLNSILDDYDNFELFSDHFFDSNEGYESDATIEDFNKFKREHEEFNIENEIKAITHWNPKIKKFISLNNDLFSQDIYKKLSKIYCFENYIFENTNDGLNNKDTFFDSEQSFIKFINQISNIKFKEIIRDKVSGFLLLLTVDNNTFDLNSFSTGQKKLISFYFELVSIDQSNTLSYELENVWHKGYEEQGLLNFQGKSYPVGII